MKLQYLFAVLVCVTAVASYINHRFIKLPKSIGLTVLSLGLSVGIMLLLSVGQLWVDPLRHYLGGFNFSATVIDGMLSYLLFAGAMNINALELSKHKSMIAALATGSVLISCLLIGYITYLTLHLLGLQLGLMPCLLFGALIAPTDPICVLSMMRRTKVPNHIRMKITGESLFNDAAGIILFVLLLQFVSGQLQHLNYVKVGIMLLQQGAGGALLGYVLSKITSYFLRQVNNDEAAIVITLALVTGGYSLATVLGVSGPIAMVVAGLVVGSGCRKPHFSNNTVARLYGFWRLVEDMMNSFLFVMIGLEVLSIHAEFELILVGILVFILLILVRVVSVTIPEVMLEPLRKFNWRVIAAMTWGGMRGGLSIALALSMPAGHIKNTIVCITYVVVILSIVIQGLSISPIIRKLFPEKKDAIL